MNGIKIGTNRGTRLNLNEVLDQEFEGWRPANFYEDFNGQTMYIGFGAIVFATSEDAMRFILKYGSEFDATPTKDISFDIVRFF